MQALFIPRSIRCSANCCLELLVKIERFRLSHLHPVVVGRGGERTTTYLFVFSLRAIAIQIYVPVSMKRRPFLQIAWKGNIAFRVAGHAEALL